MAYDEELADRIRAFVPQGEGVEEIRMFGGLCWTLNGHMIAGITRSELMIPAGKGRVAEAIARGAHELTMGRRTMSGFVGVTDPTDEEIDDWIGESVARVSALPPKDKRERRTAG